MPDTPQADHLGEQVNGAVACLLAGGGCCGMTFLLGLASALTGIEALGWVAVFTMVSGILIFLMGYVFALVDLAKSRNK